MKLTKENVYVDLIGKTEEELTELYNFLISVGEKPYRDLESFLDYSIENFEYIGFSFGEFCGLSSDGHKGKTEVTIEQLKEIIKPMENKEEQLRKEAKERGYTHDNFKCLIYRKAKGIGDIDKWHYCNISDRLYTNILGEGGSVVYENGVWAELISFDLQQQLQKAEAEVKRLKEAIEDSRIKDGDWCTIWNHDKSKSIIAKFQGSKFACITSGDYFLNCEKITDPILLESLNKLFKH